MNQTTLDDRGSSRRALAYGVLLPVIGSCVYGLALWLVPDEHLPWFNGEFGPVENISALLFLLVGVEAFRFLRRLGPVPLPHKAWLKLWFALFVAGGVFMFLEEISYGQHYFGWESSGYFAEQSKQKETNLHNLWGDRPSTLLRRVMEIGMPVFFAILPAVHLVIRDSFKPGHWPYYLLPKLELVVWVFLAGMTRPVRQWLGLTGDGPYRGSLSEYQELLWAAALLLYLRVMRRRLTPESRGTGVPPVVRSGGPT